MWFYDILSLTKEEPTSIPLDKNLREDLEKNEPLSTQSMSITSNNGLRDDHSIFVAMKYISLTNSANKRGLDCTITILELESILRNPVCYFTGEELVYYPHKESEREYLPDNYLTIDRLNPELGYVPNNVVVCSKSINKLKGRMDTNRFKSVIQAKQLVQTLGLDPQQLSLLKQAI